MYGFEIPNGCHRAKRAWIGTTSGRNQAKTCVGSDIHVVISRLNTRIQILDAGRPLGMYDFTFISKGYSWNGMQRASLLEGFYQNRRTYFGLAPNDDVNPLEVFQDRLFNRLRTHPSQYQGAIRILLLEFAHGQQGKR